jgi:hypothetical protein
MGRADGRYDAPGRRNRRRARARKRDFARVEFAPGRGLRGFDGALRRGARDGGAWDGCGFAGRRERGHGGHGARDIAPSKAGFDCVFLPVNPRLQKVIPFFVLLDFRFWKLRFDDFYGFVRAGEQST